MCEEIEFLSIPKEFEAIRNKATFNLKKIKVFMEELSDLLWGRVFALIDGQTLMPQTIINSACITLESLINCAENARFTDANTLLRKFRDDIFFFLYIICYVNDRRNDDKAKKERSKAEVNIIGWKENKMQDLKFFMVLKYIGNNCLSTVKKYDLENAFNVVGEKLNNYVHGNGKDYYNKRITQFTESDFFNQLSDMIYNTAYITTAFLFILVVIAPHLISSADYEDYLECGKIPPDDVQYYVAPFVKNFILKNQNIIDKSVLDYLKNNTFMNFD